MHYGFRLLRRLASAAALASLLAFGAAPAAAQEVLDNQGILQLTAAGVDPAVIVAAIEGSRSTFSTGVRDLLALSNARVHRDVILAMQGAVARRGQPKTAAAPARAAAPRAPVPTEFGAFVEAGGGFGALPAGWLELERTTMPDSTVRQKYRVTNTAAMERRFVVGERPAITLLLQDPAARVRMYELLGGALFSEIPLRSAPIGSDPRAVRVTPSIALDRRLYVIRIGDGSRVYGFYHAPGSINPAELDARSGVDRAKRSAAIATTLPPAVVTARIRKMLGGWMEIRKEFGADGLLITRRTKRGGGMFGDDVAVQLAVLVQRTASGSVVRVGADVYTSGQEGGNLRQEEIARVPLAFSASRTRDWTETLDEAVRKVLNVR